MNKDYCLELDCMELDHDSLLQICHNPSIKSSNLLPHQRYVSDDKYMQRIRDRYPFMGSLFNVYFLNSGLPVHVDAKRVCAVNIPVQNTENSSTIWYSLCEPIYSDYDPMLVAHRIKSKVKEEFRMTLMKPTLMNISVPHSVENRSGEPRITISWGLSRDITYETACRLFNEP